MTKRVTTSVALCIALNNIFERLLFHNEYVGRHSAEIRLVGHNDENRIRNLITVCVFSCISRYVLPALLVSYYQGHIDILHVVVTRPTGSCPPP